MYSTDSQNNLNISFLSWIKDHTSRLCFGEKITNKAGVKQIVQINHIDDVLKHYEMLRWGKPSWLPTWSALKLDNHANNRTTFYFAGAESTQQQHSLFMIDVDCKSRGTPQGAAAFLKYLTTDDCLTKYGIQFKNLYCETSTNGNGGHGFAILDKQDLGADIINGVFSRLAKHLNHILVSESFDAEFIEVKGTLPVCRWGKTKFELQSYNCGQLAKLPRDGEKRFDELKQTSVVTMNQLLRLPLTPVVSSTDGTKVKKAAVSGKVIDDETLAHLKVGGAYYVVAEKLMAGQPLPKAGRHAVTVDDVAITLMLGEWFTNHMNKSGTMPTARFARWWSDLYEFGDVSRAWTPSRFAVIRNWLSSLDLIDWQCAGFTAPTKDQYGNKINGVPAKWKFGAELMIMMESIRYSIGTSKKPDNSTVSDNQTEPVNTEKLVKWVSELVQLPEDQTITPYEIAVIRIKPDKFWPNPDELTRILLAA